MAEESTPTTTELEPTVDANALSDGKAWKVLKSFSNNRTQYLSDVAIAEGMVVQNAHTSYMGDNLTNDGYHLTILAM